MDNNRFFLHFCSYIALLEQFKAASYGDVGFGNVLLIFACPDQPLPFRRLLWSDHREALTFLKRLHVKELMIPITKLLQPFDENAIMVKLYAEFFFTEIITFGEFVSDSVVWIIAINHLNAFLFDCSQIKIANKMKNSIWNTIATLASQEKNTGRLGKLKQLVFYKRYAHGNIEIYSELPKLRISQLHDIFGKQKTNAILKSLNS